MRYLLILATMLLVAGCGQTGALFLPPDEPAESAPITPPAATEEPREDDEETPAG